jgi:hypothetical protein
MQISTIDLDIAKSVFQVHGVDAAGQVVVRYPSLLMAMETSSRRLQLKCAASNRLGKRRPE